jgi:hypothetical protein
VERPADSPSARCCYRFECINNFVTGIVVTISVVEVAREAAPRLHTLQDARPVRRSFGTGQSVQLAPTAATLTDGEPLTASAARSSSERAPGGARGTPGDRLPRVLPRALVRWPPQRKRVLHRSRRQVASARRRSHPLISGPQSTTAASRFLEWARHHAPTAVNAVLGRLPAVPPGAGRVREFIRDLEAVPRA